MNSNKFIITIILFFTLKLVGQNPVWPLPVTGNSINCSFSEVHPTISNHLHAAIDIRLANNGLFYATNDGIITQNMHTVELEWFENGIMNRTIYGDETKLKPGLKTGDFVQQNDEIGYQVPNSMPHLHLEFRRQINNQWVCLNPLENEYYTIAPPNELDIWTPNIYDVIFKPIGSNSGSFGTGIGVENNFHLENLTSRVHLSDHPCGPFGANYIFENSKIIVFGNIGIILHSADPQITTNGAFGTGLGIHSANFKVNNKLKYNLNFDKILPTHKANFSIYYNTNYSGAGANCGELFGNDDYLKLYNTSATFPLINRQINGINSNGIWSTRARNGTPDVSQYIPTTIANCPDDAKYKDGKSDIDFTIGDIESNRNQTLDPIIDNFKPYLQQVVAYVGSTKIYDSEFVCNGTCITLTSNSKKRATQKALDQNGIWVKLIFSEPIESGLTFEIPTNSNVQIDYKNGAADKTTWEYKLTAKVGTLKITDLYNLKINGVDFAGNSLLNLAGKTTCVNVPNRTGSGPTDWTNPDNLPTGADLTHTITCFGPQTFQESVDRSISEQNACDNHYLYSKTQSNGCTVDFEIRGTTVNYRRYVINFGDGKIEECIVGQCSSNGKYTHTYPDNGEYEATVEYYDEFEELISTIGKTVAITACGGGAGDKPECEIGGSTIANLGETIDLTPYSIGGTPPFKFNWTYESNKITKTGENQFLIGHNNWNHDELKFTATISDEFGNTNTCVHYVEVSDENPRLNFKKITSLDNFKPFSWIKFIYTTLDIDYGVPMTFTITKRGAGNQWSVFKTLNTYNGFVLSFNDMDEGFYKACITVAGITKCKDFKIGDPQIPIPTPAFSISPETTITLDCNGDPYFSLVSADNWFAEFINGIPSNVNNWEAEFTFTYDQDPSQTFNINRSAFVIRPDNKYYLKHFLDEPGFSNGSNLPKLMGSSYGTWSIYVKLCPNLVNGSSSLNCNAIWGTDHPNFKKIYARGRIDYNACPLVVKDIKLSTVNCKSSLVAVIENGETKEQTSNCAAKKYHKTYIWKAFDEFDPTVEIKDLLTVTAPQPDGTGGDLCVKINSNSKYFDRYKTGDLVSFFCRIQVEDFDNSKEELTKKIFINLPVRVELPAVVRRCAGTKTPLSNDPIILGGKGTETITWFCLSNQITIDAKDPWNPSVNVPANFSGGTASCQVVISEDPNCDPITKYFEIEVTPLSLTVANLTMVACNTGNSDKKMGPVTVFGGSGKYNYEWSPADYLDDPYKKEPTVRFPFGYDGTNVYTLTVRDEFGCESSSYEVSVTGAGPECMPIANAGPDLFICNGSTATLGQNTELCFSAGGPGTVGGSGTITRMKFEWTSTNKDFSGSTLPNIVIPENLNKKAGAYTYTVKVIEPSSGCYAIDQAVVNVRKPWLWKGYEAATYYIDPSCGKRVSCNPLIFPNMNFWKGTDNRLIESSNTKYNSGAVLPFTYQWLTGNQFCTSNNFNGIPAEGYFKATKEIPSMKMRVTDAAGCSKEFETSKGIVTNYSPELTTNIIGESDLTNCTSNEICFNLTYNLHSSNFQAGDLTPTLQMKYFRLRDEDPDPCGNYTIGQNGKLPYEVTLSLVDSKKGIYKGFMCIPNTQCDCSTVFCKISAWVDGTGFCGPTTSEQQYRFMSQAQLALVKDDCGEFSVVPQANAKTNQAIKVTLKKINGCAGFIVNNNFISRNIGGKNGFVDILDHTWAKSNADFFAYINPCAVNNLQDTVAEERTIDTSSHSALQLEIKPNPFLESTQLNFNINSANGHEDLSIRIINNLGQTVYNVLDKSPIENGSYNLDLQMQNVPAGIYHCILETTNAKVIKKLIKINNN